MTLRERKQVIEKTIEELKVKIDANVEARYNDCTGEVWATNVELYHLKKHLEHAEATLALLEYQISHAS